MHGISMVSIKIISRLIAHRERGFSSSSLSPFCGLYLVRYPPRRSLAVATRYSLPTPPCIRETRYELQIHGYYPLYSRQGGYNVTPNIGGTLLTIIRFCSSTSSRNSYQTTTSNAVCIFRLIHL